MFRLCRGNTVCRLGYAVPYLQTGLETGLCFYRDWQKSPLMAAWTLGSSPRQRVVFIFSTVIHLF